MTALTVQEGSEEVSLKRNGHLGQCDPFGSPFEAQKAPLEALLGPSLGSKLGSQRLEKCAFRISETQCVAFGGRLKEEAKPTKTEEPQEEAADCQKVVPKLQRQSWKARHLSNRGKEEVKER